MMKPVNGGGSTTAATPDSMAEQIIQNLVVQGFAPKLQARHLANHHMAEQMYLARQKLGQTMGLSESAMKNITPFPTPINNTFTYNDGVGFQEILAMLGATDKPQPEPPPQTPDTSSKPRTWPRWLWPLVTALGIAGSTGVTALALWPDNPPPVDAKYTVEAR